MEIVFEYSYFIIIVVIIAILEVNHLINTKKFIVDLQPYFKFLMEDDYVFLLKAKYGEGNDEDVAKLFNKRIKNGLIFFAVAFLVIVVSYGGIFISLLISGILGYFVFKAPYLSLKTFYRNNLYKISLMLPYYLKSLEILIQHYTIPVALSRSIESAPIIFKDGLKKLVAKIEAGVSSVDPYMDFAKEYPVRDSMRMMRLLYRLSLGSQENKQEQLLMFSKTVSSLQNKSRELKYQNRLDKMEKNTMIMLAGTGGGLLLLLMAAMAMMMSNI
ncbi:MAG: hypothetical protein RR847_02290 [Bacilli bacterium]